MVPINISSPNRSSRFTPQKDGASALDAFFRPRSIAVVGASRDADSMSGTLFRNVCESFSGAVIPVNPYAEEVRGRRAYPSLRDVPDAVDLAVIAVPAASVLEVARQCVEKHVKAVVVISAGFSEIDEQGQHKGDELHAILREARIPLVGPNCLGLLNTDPSARSTRRSAYRTRLPEMWRSAPRAVPLGFVYPEYMRQWGLGISKLVSVGNKLDVGENALVEAWQHDPATRVIQLYLESFQEPRKLLEIARRVSRSKPIVALKAGRTKAGTCAAGSHTAALAGPDVAAQGLFKQAGIVRVDTLEDLCGTTAILATQPLPHGRRVAVLTNAGGPAVLCADALESQGFTIPELPAPSQAILRRRLSRRQRPCESDRSDRHDGSRGISRLPQPSLGNRRGRRHRGHLRSAASGHLSRDCESHAGMCCQMALENFAVRVYGIDRAAVRATRRTTTDTVFPLSGSGRSSASRRLRIRRMARVIA